MFSRRRSLFDFSSGRLTKAPRRQKRRGQSRASQIGGGHTRLSVEQLEERRLLAVDVFIDPVSGLVNIRDATDLVGGSQVQEDNDVSLFLGNFDPDGGEAAAAQDGLVIADPDGVNALGAGLLQVSPTRVFVPQNFDFDPGIGVDLQNVLTDRIFVDLQDGNDSLAYFDSVDSVPVVTTYFIEGGNSDLGEDRVFLRGTAGAAESVEIRREGSPSTATEVNGYAGIRIVSSGNEFISYSGEGDDDDLTVDLSVRSAAARVQRSNADGAGEVLSDVLPTVQFTDLQVFELESSRGQSTATFALGSLIGANNYQFERLGGPVSDTLVIEGTPAADQVTARLVGGELNITQTGQQLSTLGLDSNDLVHVETLGGDDTLTVDVDNGLIDTPIFYDGGIGSDLLVTQGDAGVATSDYFVGLQPDEGRLEHDDTLVEQIIDFDNLEPVVDLVVADDLTVHATNASNAITYTLGSIGNRGLVSVDGFETIEFENKTTLEVNALDGDDTVVADNDFVTTGLESIIFNGNAGDDTIRFNSLPSAAVTAFVDARANGGAGNDIIDGSGVNLDTPLILAGGDENDTITGGAGNDLLSGNQGDDTFIDSPGDDLYDGEVGFDTLIFRGTNGVDIIDVIQQPNAAPDINPFTLTLNTDFNPAPETTETVIQDGPGLPTIELVRIEALGGDDIIRAGHADDYNDPAVIVNTADQTIPFEVTGDSPNASDRLIVPDLGDGDLVIQREGPDDRSGSITVGGNAPIDYSKTEFVNVTPLDPITAGTGDDGLGRLVVFKHDPFESNNTLPNATFLGAGPTINVDPTIDPSGIPFFGVPGDNDFYQFVAQETGTLDLQIYFEPIGTLANGRAGLPVGGELFVQVLDSDGIGVIPIPTATDLIDPAGNKIGERVTVPVVRNNTYYLRVQGELGDDATGINVYNFTGITTAAPIPQAVDLQTASDTGENFQDNITFDDTPTFDIILDDDRIDEFANLDLLPDTVDDNAETAGFDYGVEVFNNAVSIGFAFYTGVGNTWEFTAQAGDLNEGENNLISAAVWIRDLANPAQIGRHELSDPLQVTLDTLPPDADAPNLLDSSDSGMFNDDNVTNKWQPAFDGEAEVNNKVFVYAILVDPANGMQVGNPLPIGSGLVGSDLSNDIAGDGLGVWEVTVEPLVDGVYDIIVRFEDWAGNFTPLDEAMLPENTLRIVVDKIEPNTPLLDLITDPVTGDTGRNDIDNVTKQNQPVVTMTSEDPNVELAQVLFDDNLKFRIYDRYESFAGQNTPEFLLYDSALDAAVDAVSFAGDMFTSLTLIEETLPEQFFNLFGAANNAVLAGGVLADGVHNLKLEVEDRAGNISHDFLLEIVVDTIVPPVSFGLPDAVSEIDGLAADSDSGVTTVPATFADRITNDTTPRLWGRAEANTVVQVYLDRDADGVIDLLTDDFLGQTVAVPFDGNDAYPDGYWELVSALDLNQLFGIPKDGLRSLLVTAEDVAGNPMPMNDQIDVGVDELQIFIDTQGPQVTDVRVTDVLDYDLFDPKPSEDGPSPLVNSLRIDFRDLPNRLDQVGAMNDFLYETLVEGIAEAPGNYLLVGDHVGTIAIDTVVLTNEPVVDGQPATAFVELTFVNPLPDDRFTLTISDNLVDPANNNLDGESNADEPLEVPTFPSGDEVPGGDFVARFTIDSRPEIGTFVAQNIDLDINGNFVWDPANGQIGNDATNVDLSHTLPVANPDGSIGLGGYNVHDLVFAGLFAPLGQLIVGDDAVFVVDVSGSTSSAFGGDPVGDLNGDGAFDTILDAEIAAFIALNQSLIDRGLGNTSNVSVVAFDTSSMIVDLDPVAAGVQVSTTPLADTDGNGVRDVDQALSALLDGGTTNFEAGLQDAISAINTVGTANGNGNVIFLSDGNPNAGGAFVDEANMIRDVLGMNLRAFGVGPGASLPDLLTIDPAAETFSNTNELLAAFGGGGGGGVAGNPDGFDQLAAYGNSAELGAFRWIIDTNNDGVVNPGEGDILTIQPLLAGFNVVGAIPVAGNFDANAANGDEIGLYFQGNWAFDTNKNFVIDVADTFVSGNLFGQPIVGDFDGNGDDDLGVFNNNQFFFDLNAAGFDGNADANFVWGFPGVLDRPVAADMDQDGIDDVGLFVPRNSAQPNRPLAEWYFLISNDFGANNRVTGTVNTLDHAFETVPFGNDLYAEFGDELALPIVGNFDPPVAESSIPIPGGQSVPETGDFDQDGDADGFDFLAWQRGVGVNDEVGMNEGDGNYDGVADHYDLQLWQTAYVAPLITAADFDGDGQVDANDLAMWSAAYGAVGTPGMHGDATRDGVVSGADFLAVQRSYQGSSSVALSTFFEQSPSAPPASTGAASVQFATLESASLFVGSPAAAVKEAAFEALDDSSAAVSLDDNGQFALSVTEASSSSAASDETLAANDASNVWDLAFEDDDDSLLPELF